MLGEDAVVLVLDFEEAGADPDYQDGFGQVSQLRLEEDLHLLLQERRLGFLQVVLQVEFLGVLLGLEAGQGGLGEDGVRPVGLLDQALPGPRHELECADHGHNERAETGQGQRRGGGYRTVRVQVAAAEEEDEGGGKADVAVGPGEDRVGGQVEGQRAEGNVQGIHLIVLIGGGREKEEAGRGRRIEVRFPSIIVRNKQEI